MSNSDTANPRAVVQRWLADAVRTGDLDAYQAKRKSLRASWRQPMELLVDDKLVYVQSSDVGEGGIGLVTKLRLPRKKTVLLRRNDREPWVRCHVIHTTATVGSYKVGMELAFDFDD